MPAGEIVLQPLAQPDHLADAQHLDEDLLDRLAALAGIAVPDSRHHRFAGQQRPLAVDMDGAAFDHQVRRIAPHLQTFENGPAHRRVAAEIVVAMAPGIQASGCRPPGWRR